MNSASKMSQGFIDDECGGMTAFGIFLTVGSLAVGGLAIDVSHAFQLRTRLQLAADGAAHAAIVAIQTESEAVARADALEVIERSLPAHLHGEIIRPQDVKFGEWDEVNGGFDTVAGSKQAVLVDVRRAVERQNAVGTFLLTLVGVDTFDVWRQSIAFAYQPGCINEGYVAETIVDITSGNTFVAGFCVHANDYVQMRIGNTFADGVIVSMPDRRDIWTPAGSLDRNPGLEEALRDGYYAFNAEELVDGAYSGVLDPSSDFYPWFFDFGQVADTTGMIVDPWLPANWNVINRNDDIDATTWMEHRVNYVECRRSNQKAKIKNNFTLTDGVLITNCKVQFGSNAAMEDAILINTGTADITTSAGFRLGADDNCAPGGGASIYTKGEFSSAANIEMHGSRIVAAGDVSFTAGVGGLNGVSVISDQSISATAGGTVGLCGTDGMEEAQDRPSFRTVY